MPPSLPGTTCLTDAQLRQMMVEAAEKGARRALREVGLHDEAAADMREQRGLLEAWREARKAAWQTVARSMTTLLLGVMLAGLAVYWHGR